MSASFSLVEDKLGIFFASCPMLRQLFTYILKYRTMRPTRHQLPPNTDFFAMRKRITLRDLFWYRQPALAELLRTNPGSSTAPDQLPEPVEIKFSGLDHIWIKLKASLKLGKLPRGAAVEDMAAGKSQGSSSESERPIRAPSPVAPKRHDDGKYKDTFLLSQTRNSDTGIFTQSSAVGSSMSTSGGRPY